MSEPVKKSSLFVLFLVVFIDLLGFGIVLPLLPIYADELLPADQYSTAAQGWTIALLMASFSIMQFLGAPLWGRLSDRIGRRPVLLIGLAGSTVCYFGFGLATAAHSLTWMFVTRIGAGLAGATISTAHAYIADVTSPETRARGMALIGAAFGLGFTFGPLIGALGFIDVGATWQSARAGEWTLIPSDAATHLSARIGFLASGLSCGALLFALWKLPESLPSKLGATSGAETPAAHAARRQWIDPAGLRAAWLAPSVGLLLLASFVAVFSFGNFEATLSLLLKARFAADGGAERTPNAIDLFLVFAYVGFILTLAQGFLVRRLAKRWPEASLAALGAVVSIGGFSLLGLYSQQGGGGLLYGALAVVVIGFAFLPPTLQSLISRRSDPARQGSVLGLSQSASALARIFGPVLGIRLFKTNMTLPYWAAVGLMIAALVMIAVAARGGKDYEVDL